jgi:hypothetical protein
LAGDDGRGQRAAGRGLLYTGRSRERKEASGVVVVVEKLELIQSSK